MPALPNNRDQSGSKERPLRADFVAEVGIPTARDGLSIF
jgi:hypothetical protein